MNVIYNPSSQEVEWIPTLLCTQSTTSDVGVPGVNISATPIAFNSSMSDSGMIPPPKTTMSDAPA